MLQAALHMHLSVSSFGVPTAVAAAAISEELRAKGTADLAGASAKKPEAAAAAGVAGAAADLAGASAQKSDAAATAGLAGAAAISEFLASCGSKRRRTDVACLALMRRCWNRFRRYPLRRHC